MEDEMSEDKKPTFDDRVQEIEAIVINSDSHIRINSDSHISYAEDHDRLETAIPLEMWVMKIAEIKTNLLIAEQLRRIADVLVDFEGRESLSVSAHIWGS